MKSLLPIAVFAFLVLFPEFIWIFADRGIWPWDQACYALASVDLWWIILHDPGSYFSYISEAVLRCRAPGISVIGQFFVPLGQIYGSIEPFLLLSIFVQSYLCLLLLGATIQKVGSRSKLCPYLAILILAATPLFADMSRTFLVEQLQLLSVIYVYWVLVGFEDRGSSANLSHLIIAVSLGLVAKISSPMYCLVPVCYVLYKLIRGPLIDLVPDKLNERVLALLAAAFFLPVAFWYVHNLEYVLFAARDLSVGTMASYYGSAEPIPQKLIHWINHLARFNLVPAMYYLLPLLVVIPVFLKFKEKTETTFFEGKSGLLVAAVLQGLVILLVLSLSVPEDVRYVYGILPSLIVAYAVLISTIRNRIYLISTLTLFSIQFIVVSLSSFGYLKNSDIPFLTSYINNETKILSSPMVKADELNRLVRLAAASYREGYRIVLGVSYPWLNSNTLGFYAARAKLDGLNWFSIESWKVDMQEDELSAWFSTRKKLLFITMTPQAMEEEKSVPFANRLNKSALEYVEVRGKKIPFESPSGILLYRVEHFFSE